MTEPFQSHKWLLTSQEIKVLTEWVNTILQSEGGCLFDAILLLCSSCHASSGAETQHQQARLPIAGQSFADEVLLALRASAFGFEGTLAQRLTSRHILWESSHDVLGSRENTAIEPMFALPLRKIVRCHCCHSWFQSRHHQQHHQLSTFTVTISKAK